MVLLEQLLFYILNDSNRELVISITNLQKDKMFILISVYYT